MNIMVHMFGGGSSICSVVANFFIIVCYWFNCCHFHWWQLWAQGSLNCFLNVLKFNGVNYLQWLFQIKCALRAKGFLDVSEGRELTFATEGNDLKNWNSKDANAMFIISTDMELSQVTLIKNCESSFAILKRLNSINCII